MQWVDVFWTPVAEEHIAPTGLKYEDVEHVFFNPIGFGISKSTGLPVVFGITPVGLKIAIVFEQIDAITVHPITAFEVK